MDANISEQILIAYQFLVQLPLTEKYALFVGAEVFRQNFMSLDAKFDF